MIVWRLISVWEVLFTAQLSLVTSCTPVPPVQHVPRMASWRLAHQHPRCTAVAPGGSAALEVAEVLRPGLGGLQRLSILLRRTDDTLKMVMLRWLMYCNALDTISSISCYGYVNLVVL